MRGPADQVVVDVKGTIETQDLSGVLRGHRETTHPAVYLRTTQATRPSAALTELAREVAGRNASALDRAHGIAQAVSEAIAYMPGVTEAHTTAAEALELGEGVCQDHAHALIAAAHVLDLPGRYVTGYLLATEDGTPHEAAHAWAELWVDGLGWVGFDPANNWCPDMRYIRIGSGLDARDAARWRR